MAAACLAVKHGEHGGGGAMSVRFARFDKNFKQVEESLVDAKVCECCPTAAAVTSEGIIAAYRNRSDDEIRDNYVSRLVNGKWTTPQAVFNDNWKIAACPVNGPSLSANGNLVAMSWFTAKNDQGQAFAAFSQDAGKTFSRADSHRRWRDARARRSGIAARRFGARHLDRVRPLREDASGASRTPAHSSGRAALSRTARARRRSRSPGSRARARADIRAPRSPTVKWSSPGRKRPRAADCRSAPRPRTCPLTLER